MAKHFIYGIGGLIIGLAVGFFVANSLNRDAVQPLPAGTAGQQMTTSAGGSSSVPQQGGMQADVTETLAKAEAEPQNFAVQMRAGDMYAQIGRFDKAIEYYDRGLAINPSDFRANVVLANAYFDSHKFEEAAEYYEKALAIDPKDANARTDLGATYVERPTPDYGRAIKEFRTALEMQPNHEPALYYLGVAYSRSGDTQNANAVLAQLQSANTEVPKSFADVPAERRVVVVTDSIKPVEVPAENSTRRTRASRRPPPAAKPAPTANSKTEGIAAESPKVEAPPKRAAKKTKEVVPDPLANIRLVIAFKDGNSLEKSMSDVFKFSVDKGVLTVILKDGSVGRYPIIDVAKVTIE